MTEAVTLRVDRFGIPHHAYLQADGRYLLCKRRVELCKACKEGGVPPIPADPYQIALDLFRKHWGLRWREHYRLPAMMQDDATVDEATGAHIIALSGDGTEVTVLAQFGMDESVMLGLGALVAVHNEKIGEI
ncbi:hypothetical protein [Sphingobium sp. CECT 9361]|uniref:hypothetical protein n=1 Tax=Sphingobium sp. CECT 9361 TaxID=2845384 RepID=UPI001E5C9B12|nr:hypothetical protein [Sphingobium sp. CECT 9361]CAH0355348.1 hypothetical protein SPH9361_03425 [Sphingobium sp. CECT 9361]